MYSRLEEGDNIKPIKGFEGLYTIDENGNIFSIAKQIFIGARPTTTSKYLFVKLYKNGKVHYRSCHRLVAQNYIENPDNLPEVDHIDNNRLNNNVNNLRWITRKENLVKSYKTMGPVRNFRKCSLYKNNNFIKSFQSVAECGRYAYQNFGISQTSLQKYKIVGDYTLKCND